MLNGSLLEQSVMHLDEATVYLHNGSRKTAESRCYMWVMGRFAPLPPVIPLRRLPASAGADGPTRWAVRTLIIDRYEGYGKACKDYRITRLGCWSHDRRQLMEAKVVQKKGKAGKADHRQVQSLNGEKADECAVSKRDWQRIVIPG
ncbi:IS66 family transposase [Gilvimarinus xylanilyticus]|uniref:IS66 family transposase n=1 Tax=Gilvimarinus xylanilyticus TaxID=2944139 RepID=UPI003AF1D458